MLLLPQKSESTLVAEMERALVSGNKWHWATKTTFVQPAVGGSVTVAMDPCKMLGPPPDDIYIDGAGYYSISSYRVSKESTWATIRNLGLLGNVRPGTTIISGMYVVSADAR